MTNDFLSSLFIHCVPRNIPLRFFIFRVKWLSSFKILIFTLNSSAHSNSSSLVLKSPACSDSSSEGDHSRVLLRMICNILSTIQLGPHLTQLSNRQKGHRYIHTYMQEVRYMQTRLLNGRRASNNHMHSLYLSWLCMCSRSYKNYRKMTNCEVVPKKICNAQRT